MSNEFSSATLRPSSEAKRAAIIAAAAQAFFRHGYEAASIEAIAEDAGVSKVTVYNHFGDKRALFAASVETECGAMQQHLAFDGQLDGSLHDLLLAVGTTFVTFLSRPEIVRFDRRVAAETELHPEVGQSFLDSGPRRMLVALAAIIAHAAERGEVAVDDPHLAAEQFASMCKGFGDLERRFGGGSDPTRDRERIAGAVAVFLRAYAVDNRDRK